MEIFVPTIACQGCIDTITNAIKAIDENATIDADMPNKKLTITSTKALEELKTAIVATGHQPSSSA